VLANGLADMDPERARLAATTLAWLTSLTHRGVRDMATKALAVLVVRRRPLAADLIKRFGTINDPYVADRVLAAAYASATREPGTNGLADMANAAFAAVFAADPITEHALIRDRARGIIELAARRGVLPAKLSTGRAPLTRLADR
jgi:hypothetical protein